MPIKEFKVKSSRLAAKRAKLKVHPAKDGTSSKVEPKIKKVSSGLSADVYNLKGKVVGALDLSKEIFGAPLNKTLIAQAVRVYLANQRRGTASTKTRGEVNFSTRKIYQQKGTGRARHGAVSAPIFVHGGVAFGPKPRNYGLELPKKMKRKALFSALSTKLKEKEIKIVEGLSEIKPKTKSMVEVLLNLQTPQRKVLLVMSESGNKTENIQRAVRNIESVTYTLADKLNTYEVLNADMLVCMKEAFLVMEKTWLKGEVS